MASHSSPAKGLQQNRPRPTVPRTIIPAIPLPYVQKRKQQEAARAKAREEALAPVVVDAPTSPSPSADVAPQVVSEPDEQESEKPNEPVEQAAVSTPATSAAATVEPVEEVEAVETDNTVVEQEVDMQENVEGEQPIHFPFNVNE